MKGWGYKELIQKKNLKPAGLLDASMRVSVPLGCVSSHAYASSTLQTPISSRVAVQWPTVRALRFILD